MLLKVILCFCTSLLQAYLIGCVWNCYRYVSGRGTTEVLVYVTTNDTTVSPQIHLAAQGQPLRTLVLIKLLWLTNSH